MTVKPGDTIKIRSHKSVTNEFEAECFNPSFIGWGRKVTYLGVRRRTQNKTFIKVRLAEEDLNTSSQCVENGNNIVFEGDYYEWCI